MNDWQAFTRSGRIEDYLKYKETIKGQTAGKTQEKQVAEPVQDGENGHVFYG